MTCTIGKECNCETVDDSVQSHKTEKEWRNTHRFVQSQFQMNSDAEGILRFWITQQH